MTILLEELIRSGVKATGLECIDRNTFSIPGIQLDEAAWMDVIHAAGYIGIQVCPEGEEARLLSKFESDPSGYFSTQSSLGHARMKELAKIFIEKMAKEEEAEKLASILETIWPRNHLSYYEIVTNINQGETKDMEKCVGPVKTHPRICSFLMHQDFEFRPVPNPKKQDAISFMGFLQKSDKCLDDKDSFELCKENFCQLSDCTGKTLPDYEDFHDEL